METSVALQQILFINTWSNVHDLPVLS